MTEIFINNFNAISDELLNIEGTMYSVWFDISIGKRLKATSGIMGLTTLMLETFSDCMIQRLEKLKRRLNKLKDNNGVIGVIMSRTARYTATLTSLMIEEFKSRHENDTLKKLENLKKEMMFLEKEHHEESIVTEISFSKSSGMHCQIDANPGTGVKGKI